MRKTKTQKGITLVALIITVIVLLILAAVAIRAIKDDGIINYAKNARVEYEAGEQRDENLLSPYIGKLEEHASGSGMGSGPKMVEDYGKAVEYLKDLNGNGNYADDWKLFYAEGDTAYIIAADYLPNSLIPNGTAEENKLNMSKYGTYGAYWNEDGSSFRASKASDTITQDVANKYKLSWFNNTTKDSTNENARATADLLNVTAWTSAFGDAENGIEAIGAPTIEMWVASWNAMGEKYGTNKYVKLYTTSDIMGYRIGNQENLTRYSYSYQQGTGTEGYNNELYFPDRYYRYQNAGYAGYWLASPSANYAGAGMSVNGNGMVGNYNGIGYTYGGHVVRPLVSMPIELLVKTADGFRVDV